MKTPTKVLFPMLAGVALTCLVSCVAPPAVDNQGNVVIRQSAPALQSQGIQLFQEQKKKLKVSHDPAMNAQLQRVGQRVARQVNLPDAHWEFVVFDDKTPNAFALPGGKIGVHTGLFPITRDDAGLATVVAHEIAHVTSNHAGHRVQQQQGLALGGALIGAVLGSQGAAPATQRGAEQLYSIGTQLGVSLPFSRSQEEEADKIGLIFMAKAGYDPREAIGLWQRFAAYNREHGDKQPEWMRTHPLDNTRIRAMEAFLPAAMRYYQP